MQRRLIAILGVLVLSSSAFAQPLLDARELCDLVSKAEMEARIGGNTVVTDLDSNTRVAICNRL